MRGIRGLSAVVPVAAAAAAFSGALFVTDASAEVCSATVSACADATAPSYGNEPSPAPSGHSHEGGTSTGYGPDTEQGYGEGYGPGYGEETWAVGPPEVHNAPTPSTRVYVPPVVKVTPSPSGPASPPRPPAGPTPQGRSVTPLRPELAATGSTDPLLGVGVAAAAAALAGAGLVKVARRSARGRH
ncbi:hypothetical protein [Streptomyces beijiangensis]|uniref:Gram-positive cocci surface proteins LPxTG domain-containing protein n=1 Tax=Streptomyces beijiangensis TaxID=163361 RepID=A0A939F9X8_9ACTN|nr:hypothetical protein [Streptomyces beijiangensis]MBO0514436.1 hypothetical protein [Streptomyces beijiangensis]